MDVTGAGPRRLKVLQTWTPTASERAMIETYWPTDEVELVLAEELTPSELDRVLPTLDAIVGYVGQFPRGSVAGARNLRLIHVFGHGTDGLLNTSDLAEVRARGIVVARADPSAVSLAEFVMMAMLALSRRAVRLHEALVQRGDWSTDLWKRRGEGALGSELSGATLGIIGLGQIGREVQARATAFGMRVGAVTRTPDRLKDSGLDVVADYSELESFLGRCDYVALTVPLTRQTRGLIGREQLAWMRTGSYLVNVSRGALVDEEALWDALDSGHLAGAALDVFAAEEGAGRSGYPTSRPFQHFNTLLTPHIAGATGEARDRALAVIGDNLRRLADGRVIRNAVRPEDLE